MSQRPAAAAAAVLTLALASPGAHAQGPTLEYRIAVLQGLDKVTARVSPIRAPIGVPVEFGTLEIVARACRQTPPTEPPESAAFLEIRELPPASEPDAPPTDLFSGWMFASSPAVSALEHPVYDVWVTDCEEPAEPPPEGAPALEPRLPPAVEGAPGVEPSPPPPPADAPTIERSPLPPADAPTIERSPLPPLEVPGAPPQEDQGVDDDTAPPSE